MHVKFEGKSDFDRKFASSGSITYKVSTGEIVSEENPFKDVSYIDGSRAVLQRLHFGDFGGIAVKLIYFIMGIVTCFVIISGVMIWLVARDKKHVVLSGRMSKHVSCHCIYFPYGKTRTSRSLSRSSRFYFPNLFLVLAPTDLDFYLYEKQYLDK